uniref:Ribosomal_L7Ae domain-containing protein n=1 Tax=Globodera pallida TaxID=36090 RepID=A0A183CC04_GLOPA
MPSTSAHRQRFGLSPKPSPDFPLPLLAVLPQPFALPLLPLRWLSPAFFISPPLINALLRQCFTSLNVPSSFPPVASSSTAGSSVRMCGGREQRFTSIESLIGEKGGEKPPFEGKGYVPSKSNGVKSSSMAQIPSSAAAVGQQRRFMCTDESRNAIGIGATSGVADILPAAHVHLSPFEAIKCAKEKKEEKRPKGRGEQQRDREDKKRRAANKHKVCFGLTLEEKAQIHATEANGEGADGFCCPRCGKVFSYEYYRDKHLKFTRCVDNGNRRFPCSLCSRSFEKRDRLRIHVLHVHERYRPHECPSCLKTFSQSSSLNKHLRTHSGERPYQCPHCEKAFTASSILRTHRRQPSESAAEIEEVMETSSQNVTEKPALVVSTDRDEYEELCQLVNPIAKPLANRKLAKKVYKLVKKAAKEKGFLRHGLADVMKAFRKNEKGIVVLAGNVSPIDVYSHIPAICEEKGLPYVFTPSREHLGYKRPAVVLLVKRHESYAELFDQTHENAYALVVEPE